MRSLYFFKKTILLILILAVTMLQSSVTAAAKTNRITTQAQYSESGWLYYPDGSLPFEWSEPGMESWNLDLDLTKAKPGDELAVKVLSSKQQKTSLVVTYAIPTTYKELETLLDKYNMTLLAVSCLENNSKEKWSDKGADIIYYCYALDDPVAEHACVHFYEEIGGQYGLSEELIAPEAGDGKKWDADDESINYYAFNLACEGYGGLYKGKGSRWLRLDQYWWHSYTSIPYNTSSFYATPYSLRISDEDILQKMEEYIVEFRKVRGLPEL